MTDVLAKAGGLFAVFCFIHFFMDWVFQSHAEAMAKHSNARIRARHCAVYTVGFIPFLWIMEFSLIRLTIAVVVLFFSHFVEDTYYPVYLWARFIRKPPEMDTNPAEGFIVFIQTTMGKILMIAVDQIIHLTFLWVLVALAMY